MADSRGIKLAPQASCLTVWTELCNLCLEQKVETLLSQAKPSTQFDRRLEVSTCHHVSPPASIAPTSEYINTEPYHPPFLSEDDVVVVSIHR